MRDANLFLTLLMVGLSLVSCTTSGTCDYRALEIGKEISRAKYCQVDTDCIATRLGCPFGCQDIINRTEEPRLRVLTKEYSDKCGTCTYDCLVGKGTAKCVYGACTWLGD